MKRGDAPGEMIGFALAPGTAQLFMVRKPQKIGLGKGRGIEGNAVNGISSQKKCRVSRLHVLLTTQKRAFMVAHAPGRFPLP
ncbi:hypothetical protein [Leclercia adecarboxylata]|uniref:hypothetical protein n=1 Tax=Leclercia adecarboxylata TaxID=83655 RepID=UPI0038579B3F